jgi:hypothetical protein
MPKSPGSEPISPSSNNAPLRFFEGLEWAVPTAFAGALASFRFEQGDVLFQDSAAYDAIEGKFRKGMTAIQVHHPPRSARSVPAEIDGDRRRTSWQSEVRIEIVDLGAGSSELRSISQGKLLMTLWRGDEGWLDPDREEPPLPRSGRELAQDLEQARAAFDAKQKTRKGCRFLFVVDLASDSSRVKAAAIREALAPVGTIEQIDLIPSEAGIEQPENFHPALVVRGLSVRGANAEGVEHALRGALYGGAANSENEQADSAKTNRFSVARHGLLDEIGG